MAGFLYYFSGASHVPKRLVADLGLALDTGRMSERGVERGPDNMRGVVACNAVGGPKRIGYYGDSQTWHRRKDFWIGWQTDDPPTPADLERDGAQIHYSIVLSDKQRWGLPVAKALPSYFGLNENGERVKKYQGPYEALNQMADECWRAIEGQHITLVDFKEIAEERQHEIASAALAFNYWVGPWELDALALPNRVDRMQIIMVLTDIVSMLADGDEAEEIKKKDESDSG